MSGPDDSQPGSPQQGEGAVIRFLAPRHKSRLRLFLMAFLLAVWIAILIALYLATPHPQKGPSPTSFGMAMAFVRPNATMSSGFH